MCTQRATLPADVKYGDLPQLVIDTREDFVECQKMYQTLRKDYEICVTGLALFNKSLKNLEDLMKSKYKDATVIQQD
jgi:hypothetical protein